MNRVELVGRATKDIEIRKTGSGKSVTSFSLAVNKPMKDAGADFIQCVAWEKTADFLGAYVNKGCLLGVEGRIQTRVTQNQQGQNQYITEVICDRVELLAKPQAKADRYVEPAEDNSLPEEPPIDNDDLPF